MESEKSLLAKHLAEEFKQNIQRAEKVITKELSNTIKMERELKTS